MKLNLVFVHFTAHVICFSSGLTFTTSDSSVCLLGDLFKWDVNFFGHIGFKAAAAALFFSASELLTLELR